MFEKIEQWKEEYIIVKHIFLDFKDYPNLKISFPIGFFLILLTVAMIAACFIINKKKNDIALVARQLVRHGAWDEAHAKTLNELRLNTPSIKKAIARGGQCSSFISIAEHKKLSYEEYEKLTAEEKAAYDTLDFDSVKIYITDGARETAKKIAEQGTSSLLKPAIISLVSILLFGTLFIVMPDLLSLLNDWLAP